MKVSYYIASRYLFSKKSVNAINFISGISMLGVFVGSAALIIILSVFNGFETLVLSMYNTFTPELRIEPAKGKTFDPSPAYFNSIKKDSRVANYTEILQEKALLRYDSGQFIGLVKGVSADYIKGKSLDSMMLDGNFVLQDKKENYAVIGAAVQSYLSVNIKDDFRDIEIYSPKKGAQNSINPAEEFNIKAIHPAGVIQSQQDMNDIVIVPIGFARELLNEEKMVSFIELNLKSPDAVDEYQKEISKKLGSNFIVKNRSQQNQLLYKILQSEKWAIFLILTFVLIIAIFNIIGSLTMLVIDKQKDIAVLSSLGADKQLIRGIFFTEGMMISMIGCLIGLLVGYTFCLLQQHYGFIEMGSTNLITTSYPITLKWMDFILVFGTVILVSLMASSISSRLSVKHIENLRDDL
ncbi:FtsX-like permease family protein [Daejeonella oryzae]|uniref:FtsX-like permease family protein n=1 Tax=Daejeonella oryzae TaxID=1122943 RepID=UPI000418EE14|nr:FtsX-like permease family protein [Daejeonella oryzae]